MFDLFVWREAAQLNVRRSASEREGEGCGGALGEGAHNSGGAFGDEPIRAHLARLRWSLALIEHHTFPQHQFSSCKGKDISNHRHSELLHRSVLEEPPAFLILNYRRMIHNSQSLAIIKPKGNKIFFFMMKIFPPRTNSYVVERIGVVTSHNRPVLSHSDV